MIIDNLSAASLRDSLSYLLMKTGEDYLQYCKLAKELKSSGVRVHQHNYDFQLSRVLVDVEQHWLTQLLASLSKKYGHGSRAVLALDDLPTGLNRAFPWGKCAPEDLRAGIRYWLELYNFDGLIDYLRSATSQLDQQGKELSARDLAMLLNLSEARQTSRHLIAKQWLMLSGEGYYHERATSDLRNLSCALNVAAEEMGVPTLCVAITKHSEQVQSMVKHELGLKTGSAGSVMITNRKTFIEFKFAQSQADALLAFVKLYAPDLAQQAA
ncbi:hypothetical protein K0504_09875 [Neiella marina]|uniref:Uncharacterized protein n=1 Tax=Neiella holothuriorum TaxID=2870530 RepID=A0ABS7EGL7_9GAMM|nr:hypothetical protein [Neiella holothuriorum]MBW8191345.1 hypothetical protein [Neiella holothuriorum]